MTQRTGRPRLTNDVTYYGQYVLGGLIAATLNLFAWHQGWKIYLACVVGVAACVWFDRKRRAAAKHAYRAQLALDQRIADRHGYDGDDARRG